MRLSVFLRYACYKDSGITEGLNKTLTGGLAHREVCFYVQFLYTDSTWVCPRGFCFVPLVSGLFLS